MGEAGRFFKQTVPPYLSGALRIAGNANCSGNEDPSFLIHDSIFRWPSEYNSRQ